MSDAVRQTIALVQEQIGTLEREVVEKKRMVNSLCSLIGQCALYADTEDPAVQSPSIRSDEFYGQPLAVVVKNILLKRKAMNQGAATVAEIYTAMCQGGFNFDTDVPDNAKRNLRISLTKNSATFHKLPNSRYGLKEWYPGIKDRKANGDRVRVTAEELEDLDRQEQPDFAAVTPDGTVSINEVGIAMQNAPSKPR